LCAGENPIVFAPKLRISHIIGSDSLENGVIAFNEHITDNSKVVPVGVLGVHTLDSTLTHGTADPAEVKVGNGKVKVACSRE